MALPEKSPQGDVGRRVQEPGGPPPEIGFREIRSLMAQSRRLIASCALAAGLLAAVSLAVFVPTLYVASAKLLITPLAESDGRDGTGVGLYQVLATSDGVVERVLARLVADGVVPASTALRIGHEIDALAPPSRPAAAAGMPAFLDLVARHRNAATAATIVNVWAAAVVEEARALFRGTAAGSERLLEGELAPTNAEIESAGDEFGRRLDELSKREEDLTIGWDRRISAARTSAEESIAAFNTATRRLMEEAVAGRLPIGPDGVGEGPRSRLQEIVSARAQLARTPNVLTLEKSPSDDTLSEMLAQGKPMSSLESSLVTEEINPLHDQLTLRVLRLESELKASGVASTSQIDGLLAELESIQLERSAALKALDEGSRLEQGVLQLRRGRAIEDLRLEKSQLSASHERRLKQLGGVADELSEQLSRSVVSRVLEDVEVVKVAVPAAVPQVPMPRQLIVKVAIAVFLGGLLGLMVALFRSADGSA